MLPQILATSTNLMPVLMAALVLAIMVARIDGPTLLEQRQECLTKAQEIIKAAAGSMSEDDLTKVKDLKAKADGFKEAHARNEAAEDLAAGIASELNEDVPVRRTSETGDRVVVVKEMIEDDPKWGYKTHADFLEDVITAYETSGRTVAKNLKVMIGATAGSDEHSTFSDESGGILTPAAFMPTILTTDLETDPMAGLVTAVPMTTPTIAMAARVDKDHNTSVSGGLRVFRRAEAGDITPSKLELEGLRMTAHSLFGAAYSTREVIERSPASFAALIAMSFQTEFRGRLINERLNGTGHGEFEGIHNSGAMITVDEEAGQDADTIVYENVVNMMARCWGYGQAVWMISQEALPQLYYLRDPQGRYIWQGSAVPGAPSILLGRPVIVTEFCERLGDSGDIVLCNWSQYLEGTYRPLRNEASIHVRFTTHENCVKFWMENDGASWWKDQLQPKKGAPTLSPFVRLQARAG